MTISGGGLNINFQQTPSIYEQQTSAQPDLQKAADIGKGNVVVVPQSQQDLIPFSKMGERTTWNYKSESGHPSLLPMGVLRGSGPEFDVHDEGWKDDYALLYEQLPDETKLLLAQDTPEAKALAATLELAARALDWQEAAGIQSGTENAVNRVLANLKLPETAINNAWALGNELLAVTEDLLDEIGPNDPHYGEAKEMSVQVGALLQEVKPAGTE